MGRKREDRLNSVKRALETAECKIESHQNRLAATPRWYRVGIGSHQLRPSEWSTAARLNKTYESLVAIKRAQAQLKREFRALEHQLVKPSDYQPQMLEWLNNVESVVELLQEFRPDPVWTVERGEQRQLPKRVAQEILRLRSLQPDQRFTELTSVRSAVDEDLLPDLIYSGYWHTNPERDVGVLLPIFIQTRFRCRSIGLTILRRWTLQVVRPLANLILRGTNTIQWSIFPSRRKIAFVSSLTSSLSSLENQANQHYLQILVTPDIINFVNHDPLPSDTELIALNSVWNTCEGDITTDAGSSAFSWLADAVGGGRASWLCRKFPPIESAEGVWSTQWPNEVRDPDSPPFRSQVIGLPTKLEIWMARGGQASELVASMNIDKDALSPEPGYQREWLTKFSKAKEVGLAAEIPLGSIADDIDVIYVVGIGDEDPANMVAAHRDAGALSVLQAGIPTNSVPDHPTPDLRPDTEQWWNLAMGEVDPSSNLISLALTGDLLRLGGLPGDGHDHQSTQRTLVEALWPGLWGTTTKRLWGFDASSVAEVRDWASVNLLPEGPLPAIRIESQPYGLLPVSHWKEWVAGTHDPPIEAKLLPSWRKLLDFAAKCGELDGPHTDTGESSALTRRLSRTATSGDYAVRNAHQAQYLAFASALHGHPWDWSNVEAAWSTASENTLNLFPDRPLVSMQTAKSITVPLVEPTNLQHDKTLVKWLNELASRVKSLAIDKALLEERPNSLLCQLLLYSTLVIEADVVYEKRGEEVPPEPVLTFDSQKTILEAAADDYSYASNCSSLACKADKRHRDAISALANIIEELGQVEVERAFRAILDTAIYRIDPFLIGVAWRRVQDEYYNGANARLGAYGWIENPRPGKPGPTEGGLLVAPSSMQLATAIVARDAAVRDRERWHLELDSVTVQTALDIAKQVEKGLHLSEAIGYRIEAMVDNPEKVEALRTQFPLVDEGNPRRVVDGIKILNHNLNDLGVDVAIQHGIEELNKALEAYADLALLDGVHKTLQGRDEAAGMTMDALAGLAQPLTLDVLRTPSKASNLTTTVFLIAEHPTSPIDETPASLSEPALESLLIHLTNDDPQWNVGSESISLSDLELRLVDLAVIAPDEMERILLRGTEEVLIDPNSSGIETHRLVTAWSRALNCEPVQGGTINGSTGTEAREDMWNRLQKLRNAAATFVNELATVNHEPDRNLLARIARWGIRSSVSAQVLSLALVTNAHKELQDRLNAASSVSQDAHISDLKTAVLRLAVGTIQLPILAIRRMDELAEIFTHQPSTAVMDEWLSVTAAVRPRLAALDSVLQGTLLEEPKSNYTAWSNMENPWGEADSQKVSIAFGPSNAFVSADEKVAVGVIDGWTTPKPEITRVGHAAFGFKAPAARAPQAILIAVPPVLEKGLSTKTLVDTLVDLRKMIAARAVDPLRLSEATDYLPTAILPEHYFDL